MKFLREMLRPGWQMAGSLSQAIRHKIVAATVGRRPSKSCQVENLREIADKYFDLSKPGWFVEVGAFDGEKFSNTSWLADNGWNGIYVEPSAQFSRLCRIRHCLNKARVLNLAAGEEEDEVTLMQSDALSTMCSETFDEYGRIPWAQKQLKRRLKSHTTRVRRLDSLLEESGVPVGFDWLVVDVEGYEENVFKGFDLARWQPRMLIVELCDAHPDFSQNFELVDSANRVRETILSAGYDEIHRDPINSIFILPATSNQSSKHDLRSAAA